MAIQIQVKAKPMSNLSRKLGQPRKYNPEESYSILNATITRAEDRVGPVMSDTPGRMDRYSQNEDLG